MIFLKTNFDLVISPLNCTGLNCNFKKFTSLLIDSSVPMYTFISTTNNIVNFSSTIKTNDLCLESFKKN